MWQGRFPHGGVKAMMSERVLIGDSSEFSRNKLAVPSEEVRRAGGLVHVKSLAIRVSVPLTSCTTSQIRKRRDPHDPVLRLQPWARQFVAGEIDT